MKLKAIWNKKETWQATTVFFIVLTLTLANYGNIDLIEEKPISTYLGRHWSYDSDSVLKAKLTMGYMVIPKLAQVVPKDPPTTIDPKLTNLTIPSIDINIEGQPPEGDEDIRLIPEVQAEDRTFWLVFMSINIEAWYIHDDSLEVPIKLEAKSAKELTYTYSELITLDSEQFTKETKDGVVTFFECTNYEVPIDLKRVLIGTKTYEYPLDIQISVHIEGSSQKDGTRIQSTPINIPVAIGGP